MWRAEWVLDTGLSLSGVFGKFDGHSRRVLQPFRDLASVLLFAIAITFHIRTRQHHFSKPCILFLRELETHPTP
jgi:hypothetical protein